MKTFSSGIDSKLNATTGTEPILVVGIQWANGDETLYSDRKVAGEDYPYPKVLAIGNFDTSMAVKGTSDSLNAHVQLDDTDNSLKEISKNIDIHKTPVRIYLLFNGMQLSEKVLLFDGELVTPVKWNESDRTLSFDILSKLEGRVVGFSMEEGDFPDIPEEALGKAWPLVFGEVCHIPTVKVRAPRQGYLLNGLGIHDWTLEIRLCQAQKIRCPLTHTKNEYIDRQAHSEEVCYKIYTSFKAQALCMATALNPTHDERWVQAKTAEKQCRLDRHAEICHLKLMLTDQVLNENPTVDIFNGVEFPQGETLTLYVDGAAIQGSFSGNTFTITERQHSKFNDWEPYECEGQGRRRYQSILMPSDGTRTRKFREAASQEVFDNWSQGNKSKPLNWSVFSGTESSIKWSGDTLRACDEVWSRDIGPVGGVVDSWKAFLDMDGESFDWHPPGSDVFLSTEAESIFVVSLIPGVVTGVAAYKTLPNGKKLLTTVPAYYYEVQTVDYGAYNVVEIHMERDLNLLDEDFDSQLYVSFISEVGPNVADVITWLAEQYTDLDIDAASFASVKTDLANYPCNMYLLDRPNVYQLIQDIARQGRCGIFVRNNTLFLRYLSKEPTPVLELTASDILYGSFEEYLSDSSDIFTHHLISYTKAGAELDGEDNNYKIDLKYNVEKYGASNKETSYYTQNTYSTILKSATFWLIRESNSWRMIKFKLPMKYMALDIMDCITLNFPEFSSGSVKCIITEIDYSSKDYTITVECWTPIRSGENEEYFWAWPADKTPLKTWPLPGDDDNSNGYNSDMRPPEDHLLAGGFHTGDHREMSLGDKHPSDLDDVFPGVVCLVSDELDYDLAFEEAPELKAWNRAKSNLASQQEQAIAGGGGGGSGSDDDGDDEEDDEDSEDEENKETCGKPSSGACGWCVKILWHQSTSQGTAAAHGRGPCGGPCHCVGGCPSCTGNFWTVERTYTSLAGAIAFARANPKHGDWWECMEKGVYKDPSITQGRSVDANTGRPCQKVTDEDAVLEPNVQTNGMVDNAHVNDSDDPYWTNPNIPSEGAGVGTPSGELG
jgi:hypothetical protein